MSNFGFFRALDEVGIKYQKTDVGDKYVYACMREHGYSLGGEQSGHIIFGDIGNAGDGITASLRIMEAIRAEKESLSTLVRPVTLYPQLLADVRMPSRERADAAVASPQVQAATKRAEEFLAGDGRVFVRASGTEPLVRILAEAPTDELCRKADDIVLEAFKG